MTTLSFPTLSVGPRRVEWQLIARSFATSSPLDLSVQQQQLIGAKWGLILEIRTFTEADANLLKAFLVKLQGGVNLVELWNFERPTPQGSPVGGPTIKVVGAGQTGASLNTNGWTPGSTIKAGDMFGVGGELKMCTADGTSSDGNLTVAFQPPLRAAPADDAPLTFTRPTSTFRLTEDTVRWSPIATGRPDRMHDFVMQFVEEWR